MSKRHQASRRKAYGRRQHEVRERTDRQHTSPSVGLELDEWGPAGPTDPFAFVDPRSPRLRFVVGE
ncbi:MAG: hypothetical protein ACJ761_06660 [Chloroflexota bacterium]